MRLHAICVPMHACAWGMPSNLKQLHLTAGYIRNPKERLLYQSKQIGKLMEVAVRLDKCCGANILMAVLPANKNGQYGVPSYYASEHCRAFFREGSELNLVDLLLSAIQISKALARPGQARPLCQFSQLTAQEQASLLKVGTLFLPG